MSSCVLASLLSRLLDLAVHRRRDAREQALEVLLVRHQLRILQRTQARRVRPSRWEKLALAVVVAVLRRHAHGARATGRQSLVLFSPETVLRWHRELVGRMWTFRRRSERGRPPVTVEVETLILRRAEENPSWGS